MSFFLGGEGFNFGFTRHRGQGTAVFWANQEAELGGTPRGFRVHAGLYPRICSIQLLLYTYFFYLLLPGRGIRELCPSLSM